MPLIRFLIKLFFCLFIFVQLISAQVTLEWDANTEPDIKGYKVYYGTSSRTYGTPIIILGNTPTYTFENLPPGTYYFAVTAFNLKDLESGYSNEVSTTVTTTIDGDINGDGLTNIVDLQLLINAILGLQQIPKADLNSDGQIDVTDLQIIVNLLLK